ncbi:ribosomal protein L7/L12 [Acidovorax sp. sic0104]|uniref:ribosomal protein L7/L12 n=1 Tax=Acidovorax sp. sic0104 TaxID=2854784 RepID=UPI001C46EE58|nr:ribosomal protein L7/L12 [Acidovorax sp. sic0104]MBV7539769.1 ribosomal protein L7/L12 [Acidovorax sp. sic0104]
MRHAGSPLPPDVLTALDDGHPIEAIKRLRAATGLGLKEAKDLIDAHQRGEEAAFAARSAAPTHVPDAVRQALAEGNKIEAVRLLRDHEGLGLKEAKDRADAIEQSMAEPASMGMGAVAPGLSPGQQPGGGAGNWILVAVVAAITVLAYFWMRGGA